MAGSDIQYTVNNDEMLLGQDGVFIFDFTVNDEPATSLTNTSYTVRSVNGTVSTGTPPISENTLTIEISSSFFQSPLNDCSIQISVLVNDFPLSFVHLFDVCKYQLLNPVKIKDLEKPYPDIKDSLWEDENKTRDQIKDAFNDVKEDIKKRVDRARWIVDTSRIKVLVKHKALSIIFNSLFQNEGDVYFYRAEKEEKKYETELKKTEFKVDTDNDGVPDSESHTVGNISLSR